MIWRPTPEAGRSVAALDRLDDTLANAARADEHGFDVFPLREHHSHKFAVASPTVVFVAIAGGTDPCRARCLARWP